MELRETIAIVTGGASGLGEATTRRIVAAGGKVMIFDQNEERGSALVHELGAHQVSFLKTDVASAEEVERHVAETVSIFGTVNALVNCAGIATPGKVVSKGGPMALERFTQLIQVNLIGTFNVIRVAAAAMMDNEPNEEGERGVIVNTASVAAFEGQIGQAAYSASKGGVVGMTLPIAREFAPYGIRVMTIAPGLVETPLFAGLPEPAQQALVDRTLFPKRLGKPEEYAKLVESIVTNPLLNGEVIRLDGAIRMQAK
ncbi:SDR family NAD(P)-dependent oxidoreductase [Sporosarcina oncorhynchi]|uniref:SDR family NAD(P)-dependent oxidoreductase n=1 Tax=Sporosarcina oncorhynchi TaxID=3056444 RepID=A0ABZ0L6V9_9BACL|nr:SDR family NAD(P)-dependent oxidoreductase [Sporosarcina sp. T2O-4]WOV87798.1 SDR family NAD(P)-dependent oxidoreductase [Sporosarcina sp. T2O-4]